MCGILLHYSKASNIDESKFIKALTLQNHRGPDNLNFKKISDNLIFGHVRLSIIDLSKNSNQPFINQKTNNNLIFNGEIYNYIELKEKLISDGINFSSTGDTEVLLKYIEKYGIDGIEKFNGMWAFAIHLSQKNQIILSRDRFGKKPLYYFQDDKNFIASS